MTPQLEYQNGVQLATCQTRLGLVSDKLADARRAFDIAQANERAAIARAAQAERLLARATEEPKAEQRAHDFALDRERAVIARAAQAERLLRIESARYTAALRELDAARAKLAQTGEVNHSSAQNTVAGQPAASSAALLEIAVYVLMCRDAICGVFSTPEKAICAANGDNNAVSITDDVIIVNDCEVIAYTVDKEVITKN